MSVVEMLPRFKTEIDKLNVFATFEILSSDHCNFVAVFELTRMGYPKM